MPELKDVFYEILVSHNHEIVMAGDWLALLAEELAEAAQPGVEPTLLCGGHPGGSDVKKWICKTCVLPIPHSG